MSAAPIPDMYRDDVVALAVLLLAAVFSLVLRRPLRKVQWDVWSELTRAGSPRLGAVVITVVVVLLGGLANRVRGGWHPGGLCEKSHGDWCARWVWSGGSGVLAGALGANIVLGALGAAFNFLCSFLYCSL